MFGFDDETHGERRLNAHRFPKVIDTKYLSTYAEGDLNASPTLQEVAEKHDSQPLPDIGRSIRAP